MLSWLFRKKSTTPEQAQSAHHAAQSASTSALPSSPATDWQEQLETAKGNDSALLALASSTSPHDIRLAAVQALTGTEALRDAEQKFRGRDKTLYRAARQALDTLRQKQETQEAARQLLDKVQQLTQAANTQTLPANDLVDLDQAWRKLDLQLLDEIQRDEFTRQQRTLIEQVRERAERQREEQRQHAVRIAEAAAHEEATRQTAALQQQHELSQQKAVQQARADAQAQERKTHLAHETTLLAAEKALANGQINEAGHQLSQLREALHTTHGNSADHSLHNRLQALLAEHTHLKSWQNWGGEQARIALIEEAETLAALASQPQTLKQRARSIEQLRTRWKALSLSSFDHAAAQALWHRFDAALTLAWQPIATQQQNKAAEREENLQARQSLLACLEQQPIPEQETNPPPNWHALIQALESFHSQWRKLGPLQHTVPKQEITALQERYAHTLTQLETPLREARQQALARRRQLIAQVKTLSAESTGMVDQVRGLQAEWQAQSRTLPLSRHEEQTLWSEFKADTDALFQRRAATRQARHDERATHEAECAALIDSINRLAHDEQRSPSEQERELVRLEQQWRTLHRPPKAQPDKLGTVFRTARHKAQKHIEHTRQLLWRAACASLREHLDQCEQHERTEKETDQAISPETTPPPLTNPIPVAWHEALHERRTICITDAPLLDNTLLRLEALLERDSPPQFQAARRELKLKEMKHALENRTPGSPDRLTPLMTTALRLSAADATQIQRLHALLDDLAGRPHTLLPV